MPHVETTIPELDPLRNDHSSKTNTPSLRFGPAGSFKQLCEAFRLVYSEYLKCGYQVPNGADMRYSALQLLPTSRTFVAAVGDCVVGTGTVVVSSPAGLPSSDVFGDVFADLEQEGRTVAEGTLLACVDSGGLRAHSISFELMPWMLGWTLESGADDFCLVANPKHVPFWHNTLGLEILAEPRLCGHVCEHPGILLRAPLRELRAGAAQPSTLGRSRVLDKLPADPSAGGFELSDEEVALLLAWQPGLLHELPLSHWAALKQFHPKALWLAERSALGAPVTTAA